MSRVDAYHPPYGGNSSGGVRLWKQKPLNWRFWTKVATVPKMSWVAVPDRLLRCAQLSNCLFIDYGAAYKKAP